MRTEFIERALSNHPDIDSRINRAAGLINSDEDLFKFSFIWNDFFPMSNNHGWKFVRVSRRRWNVANREGAITLPNLSIDF